jgi:cell division protein FtsW
VAHAEPIRELHDDVTEARIHQLLRGTRRDLPVEGQILLLVTLGLTAFGQVMVFSASGPLALTSAQYHHDPLYFVKHGVIFTLIGVAFMLLAMRMKPSWLKVGGPGLLLVSIVLLVAVLVPGIGQLINGARRWIAVGPISIQPSELVKIGLLGTVAALLAARKRPPSTLLEIAKPIGIVTALACGLILKEPDLGSSIAVAVMVFGMLFVAGTPLRLMGLLAGLGLGGGFLAIMTTAYRRERFFAFLNPTAHRSGSWQTTQGLLHYAAGGVSGTGIGAGTGKNQFVPEAHTDMIFSVIGEELGLVGAVLVILAFALFAWAGFTIAMRARDRFSQILAGGATALIAGQAAINVGAVVGILPLTGVPLPLISYGSSGKMVMLLIVGVLLSICREGRTSARRKPSPSRAGAMTRGRSPLRSARARSRPAGR